LSHATSSTLQSLMVALEKLNLTLVLLGVLKGGECAEITPLAGSRVFLTRIQTELSGFEFADHVLQDAIPLEHAASLF
jgi:hypothetical protein